MKRKVLAILATSAGLAMMAVPGYADTIFEVEHARATARSGGPITEMDADLLRKYGALSGTPGWDRRYRGHAEATYGYEEPRYYRPRHYRQLR